MSSSPQTHPYGCRNQESFGRLDQVAALGTGFSELGRGVSEATMIADPQITKLPSSRLGSQCTVLTEGHHVLLCQAVVNRGQTLSFGFTTS